MSGKIELNIRLIMVVKNKNCQAYFCVFSVFPSSSLSRRFCVFNKLSFHFPRRLQHGLDLFSTAQEQPHFDLSELRPGEFRESRGKRGNYCFLVNNGIRGKAIPRKILALS